MNNNLLDSWNIWVHFNDNNWDIDSYKNIFTINNKIELKDFLNLTLDIFFENSMFFIMRNNIKPLWEDVNNINGGNYSFKINCINMKSTLKNLLEIIISNNLEINNENNETNNKINGISLSYKKNFYILKIWINNCDPNFKIIHFIDKIKELKNYKYIFKKHNNNNSEN